MSEVVLKADATFGLKVQVADTVQQGDEIGTKPDTSEPLTSPVSGIIKGVSFNAEDHTFEILIEPA
jgi:Na+-translocating ferredoxin:NAD+ oxidoreductase RnfC subunit